MRDSDDLEKHLTTPQHPKLVSLSSFADEICHQDAIDRARKHTKQRSSAAGLLAFSESLRKLISDLQAGTLVAYAHHPDKDDLLAVNASYWHAKANALTDRKLEIFLDGDSSMEFLKGHQLVLQKADAINWLKDAPGRTVVFVEAGNSSSGGKNRKKPRDWLTKYESLRGRGKWCVGRALMLLTQQSGITTVMIQARYEEQLEDLAEARWKHGSPSESSIRRYVQFAMEGYAQGFRASEEGSKGSDEPMIWRT